MGIAARIAWHRRQLAALERQQRADLLHTITTVVGPGVAFTSIEVWRHQAVSPAVRQVLEDLEIHTPKQLGKRLQTFERRGLERVGRDGPGIVWVVSVSALTT